MPARRFPHREALCTYMRTVTYYPAAVRICGPHLQRVLAGGLAELNWRRRIVGIESLMINNIIRTIAASDVLSAALVAGPTHPASAQTTTGGTTSTATAGPNDTTGTTNDDQARSGGRHNWGWLGLIGLLGLAGLRPRRDTTAYTTTGTGTGTR